MNIQKEKLAWVKFYPSDHLNDMELSSVSLAAQGFWVRLWSLMQKSEARGYLQINGRPASNEQIARVTGVAIGDVKRYLKELGDAGVYSKTKTGVIYCRRMVRDTGIRQEATKTGKRGYLVKLQNELATLPVDSPRRDEILAEFKRLRFTPKADPAAKSSAPAGNGKSPKSRGKTGGAAPGEKLLLDGTPYWPGQLEKLQSEMEKELALANAAIKKLSGGDRTKKRDQLNEYNKHRAEILTKIEKIKAARGIPVFPLPRQPELPAVDPADSDRYSFENAEKSDNPQFIERAIAERRSIIDGIISRPKDDEFTYDTRGKLRKGARESIEVNQAAIKRLEAKLEKLNPVAA